ncbi:hypothetical protein B0H13DRAFT_1900610 [Mycena leptocephala]|nr:hypothetical protein B0H13DRAFT_1900610 [Mycena leptocephala]
MIYCLDRFRIRGKDQNQRVLYANALVYCHPIAERSSTASTQNEELPSPWFNDQARRRKLEETILLKFVHIDSKKPLDSFSAFVRNMKVQKIQDWWAHKETKEWIILCLVKSQSLVKLQSLIPADVWDSTPSMTNTNEASTIGLTRSPV